MNIRYTFLYSQKIIEPLKKSVTDFFIPSPSTPDQKIESLGPIILNPDGTYKLSKTQSSIENNISDATVNETKKEGPRSPTGN